MLKGEQYTMEICNKCGEIMKEIVSAQNGHYFACSNMECDYILIK